MSARWRLSRLLDEEPGTRPAERAMAGGGGCLIVVVLAAIALPGLGCLSFLGWLAYLLVMHFTHGGAS